MKNPLCDLLGIKYPIIQGGMAWLATAELAAAVSNAGGFGIVAAGGMAPELLEKEIEKTMALTDKPFGVNIMMMSPYTPELFDLVCRMKVAGVTTGAGNPAKYAPALKAAGVRFMPVVPSVAIAKKMERAGADIVIAEGTEAGGHIGEISTMALVPQVSDAVGIPVVAAGGIADGRGVAAAFALGAAGVQIGTRFIASKECRAAEGYKNAIIAAKDRDAVVTGRKTGHPVRGLKNKLTREFDKLDEAAAPAEDYELLGAGALERAFLGDAEKGSLMAGQGAGLIGEILSCRNIISALIQGAGEAAKKAYDAWGGSDE